MKFCSILAVLAILLVIPVVYAEVQYPVQELGNCESQQDCETYCDSAQHMETCIDFAEKTGLMTQEEIAEARKVLPFMLSGETPGGCQGKTECDAFCNKDENLQECIAFAEKAGLITGEELEMVKKTGGKGPGGCKGKEECDAFCEDESHFSECVDFAVQYGMMDAKDAEMAKKTGGKGPGNCKSKEECDAFCNNPDNQETCMNFAIEHGLMSEEELANMNKNREFMDSEEGKCTMQCLRDAGVDSKACGENGVGPEACKTCGDKCFPHDETSGGKCLSQEKWKQLNEECQGRGSGYHLEEVKGDDGRGGECVVDETCVYSSGEEWESQEEKDRKLAEMEEQWAREEAEHEAQYGPGSQQEGSGGSSGGCTQPGPEGQCNPGPGSGDGGSGGSEGSSEGSDSSGTDSGDSGGGDSGGSGSEESSGSSGGGGGEVAGTGMVIMKSNSSGIITRLIEYFGNVF